MSTTEVALTAHLLRPNTKVDDEFLHQIAQDLHDKFQIGHVTIQVEGGNTKNACKLADPHTL